MMEYENFNYTDKTQVELLLNSEDSNDIIEGLVGMVNGIDDWFWLQEKLLIYIHNEDYWIAKNAITGLGDVARIHGILDKDKVLLELRNISKENLQGDIKEAIDDIEIFLDGESNVSQNL